MICGPYPNCTESGSDPPPQKKIPDPDPNLQLNHVVLIFDGNLEIGAHVRSILCYLICLRHLIREQSQVFFLLRKDLDLS